MTNKSPLNDIKDKVHGWLMEDGWKIQKETLPDTSWAFIAEDARNRRIVVGQKIGKEDQLLMQASVIPSESVTTQLDQLPENEISSFIWDLRFELLRANLDFDGVMFPLKKVGVMNRIFTDALTQDTFVQRLGHIHKGVITVQWVIARKFDKPTTHEDLGYHTQK